MSSKWSVLLFNLLVASSALAQVNMDQPVGSGRSDHLFRSAVDPKLVYYIPIGIRRIGDYQVSEPDKDHLVVRFEAGQTEETLKNAEAQLARLGMPGISVRLLRPTDVEVDPKGYTNIGKDFEPELLPLGDLDLAVMPYALRVNHFSHVFGPSGATKLFKRLFETNEDNAGVIKYSFNGTQGGKQVLVRTAIGVFVGEKSAPSPISHLLAPRVLPNLKEAPEVLQDKEANCWDSVQPGQYCLRVE